MVKLWNGERVTWRRAARSSPGGKAGWWSWASPGSALRAPLRAAAAGGGPSGGAASSKSSLDPALLPFIGLKMRRAPGEVEGDAAGPGECGGLLVPPRGRPCPEDRLELAQNLTVLPLSARGGVVAGVVVLNPKV